MLRVMTPERWQQVKVLYDSAQLRPLQERAAWLLQAAPHDPELRQEVASLIDSNDRANSFLETPAVECVQDVAKTQDLVGRRVGAYEFAECIGAGGMGEVYKARDTRLDRTVAVKVLPPHVARDHHAKQRFEREARAVAALNHPHICTLHDMVEAPSPDPSIFGPEPIRFAARTGESARLRGRETG